MFQFPGFASISLFIQNIVPSVVWVGFPIWISLVHWLFAPTQSFSQLIASFLGSWCQGILHAPFVAWPLVRKLLLTSFSHVKYLTPVLIYTSKLRSSFGIFLAVLVTINFLKNYYQLHNTASKPSLRCSFTLVNSAPHSGFSLSCSLLLILITLVLSYNLRHNLQISIN